MMRAADVLYGGTTPPKKPRPRVEADSQGIVWRQLECGAWAGCPSTAEPGRGLVQVTARAPKAMGDRPADRLFGGKD